MQSDPSNTTSLAPSTTATAAVCTNCGAPLYGKYCYACGQSVHGLVRHFGSVVGDVADSVFNIDERVFKTLGPLYLRPGWLTLEYFAGRRVRYVTPFRLVFFLAIVAFFALQLSFRVAEHAAVVHVPGAHATAPQASASNDDTHFSDGAIHFNDKVIWNQTTHAVRLTWLPDAANDWLNGLVDHFRINMHRLSSGDPDEMKAELRLMLTGMFSVAPTVLFVLLPVFALLLKLFYIFKRRLYMEHLIVAMHSHAFLMLSILVLVVLGALHQPLQAHAGWIAVPFALLEAAAWIWIFVYLFLMQKRVYRQGWIMTSVKFWCVGWCYGILLVFCMAAAALISLTNG